MYNAASRKAGTGWKGRLFLKAAEAARDWSRMQQAGERPTAKQIAQHLSYEASVYRTVRSALGPRIRYVACGGAPLDVSLAHFFNGIGLPMIQGYGMTETAAPFAATRVTDNVIGTVGQPAPGSSVRISDDGELQVKGPNVFRGYHNLPEKTAEAFTEDGWLKTGDLASIDDEGRITITGRKKDIIITAGGKNVSPIPMEQEIVKCPIVEHVVVVGDQSSVHRCADHVGSGRIGGLAAFHWTVCRYAVGSRGCDRRRSRRNPEVRRQGERDRFPRRIRT